MRKAIAFISLFLMAACSSQTHGVLPPNNRGYIPSLPKGVSNTVRRHGTLRLSFVIPRATRKHARYVSASTKGLKFEFIGAGPVNEAVSVGPKSPGCKSSRRATTCTFVFDLLSGRYRGSIYAYDRSPVGGKFVKGSRVLSEATNVPFKIVGGVNHVGFTLDGVVASLKVTNLPMATLGTAFLAQPFTVTAMDRDGNVVMGTYENPVTLSDSDSSGVTSIASRGSDGPPPETLLSSSDRATLSYTGTVPVSVTIGASAMRATAGSANFAVLPVITSITSAIGLIGTHVTETLAGHFLAGATTVNVTGTGVTMTEASAASATSIDVTFLIDAEAAVGKRSVTVSAGGFVSPPQSFTVSNAGVDVVSLSTDSTAGTPPGSGAGTSGDLRYAILNAHAGDTIVFDTAKMCAAASCKLTLSGPLPPIVENLAVDGGWFLGGNPRITIDGNNLYRAFWIDTGTVAIADLQVQNALARGGSGADSAVGDGGGGAGLGAGLFVNQSTAIATVENVYFLNDAVAGGNGGGDSAGFSGTAGGGGGGLGGNGGPIFNGGSPQGGSGGGGVLGSGVEQGGAPSYVFANGSDGGIGGGGGGGGCCSGCGASENGTGGMGGAYYAMAVNSTGGPGGSCSNGSGGAGGFGGGGGGAGLLPAAGAVGGAGGFGGGGGGAYKNGAGNGGPGGGGGGAFSSPGSGGSLSSSVHGGNGSASASGADGSGGGGAAAGPAIFVNAGTLTTANSGAASSTATAGLGGVPSAGGAPGSAGTSDATPVFNYSGTV
ncbi:MAG: hypothetical protein JO277_00125, partial [Candidatus Eremiobacteraeota bacterium]|nr:hypothetical protein [Candidatus Eremiobacteraeota bacterium]